MLPLRLNRKIEIRKQLPKLTETIRRFDWASALLALDRLETHLINHFISRNSPSLEELRKKIESIRYYLTADCPDDTRYIQALDKIKGLIELVTPPIPKDPFPALKYIYDAIREDWAAYWESEDAQGVQALEDDFEEIRQLEPKFKALQNKDVYEQFRKILQKAGEVSALMSAVRVGRVQDKTREGVFTRIQELFSNIETLMAPEYFKFEVEKKAAPETPGGITLDELEKGLKDL